MNPKRIVTTLEQLRGLRGARWLRESSFRQGDKFGPGAQRQMQDRSIEQHGIIDGGLSWLVLQSAWSGPDSMKEPRVIRSADFQAMLRAAQNSEFDVLLVGYTSRFLRDVQLTLHYRRTLQNWGVVILMCDDRLLSSDPNDWERLVDKVKADEMYSRTLSRNVRTGLEEKRRSKGDPGGQPPLGFRRNALKRLEIEPATMPTVRRAFELSAAGQPDHDVADALGLNLDTVRHVLTNAIYIGQLQDGKPFALGATIEVPTWSMVKERRELRRTRVPGVAKRRCYPLKLTCGECGLPLQGHNERYRHAAAVLPLGNRSDLQQGTTRLPACPAFVAAQPEAIPVRGRHKSTAGTSYPSEWYEAIVECLLDRAAIADESAVRRVVAELALEHQQPVDQYTLARINRSRSEAYRQLEETRDVVSWLATVARLDAEEAAARAPLSDERILTEPEIRNYLADLGQLWRSSDNVSRQGIFLALFAQFSVLGFREAAYEWSTTARAYGLDQIVPSEFLIDLGSLGLCGAPNGTFTVRLAGAKPVLRVVERAG